MIEFSNVEELKAICLKCGNRFGEAEQSVYGWHSSCFEDSFGPSDETFTGLSRIRSGAPAGSLDDSADSVRSPKFHGHFPKYTMSLAGKSYLAKLGSKGGGYEGLALAEKVCNDIGRILGIPIAPNYHLIWFKSRPCFLVRNFMDAKVGDLTYLASFWPKLKDGSLEPYFIEILVLIVRERAGYTAVKIVILTIIFDFLIGNGDRHRQNFGFIRSAEGLVLSPIYDNVSDLGLEDEDFLDPKDKMHPAMRVTYENKRDNNIDGYLEAMVKLGFRSEVNNFVTKIKSKKQTILNMVEKSLVTKNLKVCLYEIFNRRSSEIFEAWGKVK